MSARYILLTAAKNEEDCIGEAIESVLRQSIPPLAWFIVDDGSTDRTAQIIQRFAAQHPFIRLLSGGGETRRSFGAKDRAINAARAAAQELEFDFIGVQDADVALERNDYYEKILGEFARQPKLGIAGGYIYERAGGEWRCRPGNSEDSVAGGIQMFRRACFDRIGGYTPLHHGGEDWLAQLDAKMAGWEVRACPELHAFHFRPTSSAGGKWRGLFRLGQMDASFGSHPIFEFFKCGRRIAAKPVLAGSLVRLAGFVWWKMAGRPAVIPPEKIFFLRREQMAKVRRKFWPFGKRADRHLNHSPVR